MTRVKELRNWQAGDPLRARHLQEGVDAIRDLQGVLGISEIVSDSAADRDTNNPEQLTGVQKARLVSKETRTERIEDADDPDTYVDVEITTSITWELPDGTLIKYPFE